MPPGADELRVELIEAGRQMIAGGLAWGNAGNISARLSRERCLITASGTNLGELRPEDLIECPLNGPVFGAARRPSKELPMHQAAYLARPDVNCVLHGAPFYATLVSAADVPVPADWFVEDMYYLERVARVPYHHPGSESLALAVREHATGANVLLLENHGALVFDVTVREALMGLQTLEVVCHMVVEAAAAHLSMRPLSPETVRDFLNNSGYRGRREWPS